jgi:hypothetical protein
VQGGDGRCLYSDYGGEVSGLRLRLDYDFSNNGDVDYNDLELLVDYWLVPGVNMTDDITSEDEIIGLGHFASYAAQYSNLPPPDPDTSPPTTPQNVKVLRVTDTSAEISWDPSTDDIAIAGYNIYRWDTYGNITIQKIDTSNGPSYTDTNLEPSFSASYEVSAFDKAGNHSSRSDEVFVYTDPGPNLVLNSSFETDPLHDWEYWPGIASWDTDTSPPYGEGSLQVFPDTNGLALMHVVPLPKTDYILSGWIKTENIIYLGLWITYDEFDSENEWKTKSRTLPIVGDTTEWTYYETAFRTSRDFEKARVACRWHIENGTGWFDDIKLVPAESEF